MNTRLSPCYQCEKRTASCHSSCLDYLDWSKELRELKDSQKDPLSAYKVEKDARIMKKHTRFRIY